MAAARDFGPERGRQSLSARFQSVTDVPMYLDSDPRSVLGRRICVYGWGGKTILAAAIGRALGLRVVELDAISWAPNWTVVPHDVVRERVREAIRLSPDGWVVDGNYSYLRPDILPCADSVVWLRLPYRVGMWRTFRRTVARAWDKRPICGENYESWRQAFFSRDSILLWVHKRRDGSRTLVRDLREMDHSATVIELHSAREQREFQEWLDRENWPGRGTRSD